MSCEAAIAKLSYLLAEYDDTNVVKAKLEVPIRGEMEDTNYNRRRKSLRNVLFTEAVLAELEKFPADEVCGCSRKTGLRDKVHISPRIYCIRCLVHSWCSPNVWEKNQAQAHLPFLMLSTVSSGLVEAVKRLITHWPDAVHVRDYDRRTPLHIAAARGDLRMVWLWRG